jgi:hypothetical protein
MALEKWIRRNQSRIDQALHSVYGYDYPISETDRERFVIEDMEFWTMARLSGVRV